MAGDGVDAGEERVGGVVLVRDLHGDLATMHCLVLSKDSE